MAEILEQTSAKITTDNFNMDYMKIVSGSFPDQFKNRMTS
jgi:hypothetical protein